MRHLYLLLQLLGFSIILQGQPAPGNIFKEYAWFNELGDCHGALRVGGQLDYRVTGLVDNYKGNGLFVPDFDLDLEKSIRAELVVEKMLCHGGTEGLRIVINGYDPVYLPESGLIPRPQSSYAHHFNVVVPVDLSYLKPGIGNTFTLEVDTAGHWWPQNLVYGMILRVYYDDGVLNERGRIGFPEQCALLGELNKIRVDVPEKNMINKIDLVGFYDDVDLEGDGLYRQWHYSYHKGQVYNHIGTLSDAPYEYTWNTEWVPDQEGKMELAAFIHRTDGFIYMTEAVSDLELKRPGLSVELCKPYRRPKGWFTRNGEFTERFQVKGKIDQALEAKMVFRSWSPGYFNGIYINNFIVFMKEGPRYAYYVHDIPIEELQVFESGENILKTGKTPKYYGKMVHGVEIQWPGIMILIKYYTSKK